MDLLVSTQWLARESGAADLRIVDATWFMPGSDRDAASAFEKQHIPGAVFMDLDELADTGATLPNMVPPAEKFASRMQALGLGDGSRVVVYDDSPYRSAARAWWLLTMFGAHEVAILDGGLAKWRRDGHPLESGKPRLRHRHFTVWRDDAAVRSKADMITNLAANAAEVVDARSGERFAGIGPEPRPGVEPGHIPGSRNLPYDTLFEEDGTWKAPDALRAAFIAAGVTLDRPVVTTCGSGMTAAVLLFGLRLLGKSDVALYDGSWSEWGADPTTPKALGPA